MRYAIAFLCLLSVPFSTASAEVLFFAADAPELDEAYCRNFLGYTLEQVDIRQFRLRLDDCIEKREAARLQRGRTWRLQQRTSRTQQSIQEGRVSNYRESRPQTIQTPIQTLSPRRRQTVPRIQTGQKPMTRDSEEINLRLQGRAYLERSRRLKLRYENIGVEQGSVNPRANAPARPPTRRAVEENVLERRAKARRDARQTFQERQRRIIEQCSHIDGSALRKDCERGVLRELGRVENE